MGFSFIGGSLVEFWACFRASIRAALRVQGCRLPSDVVFRGASIKVLGFCRVGCRI